MADKITVISKTNLADHGHFAKNGAQFFIEQAEVVTKENGTYYYEKPGKPRQPLEAYLRAERDSKQVYKNVSDEAIAYFLEGQTDETNLSTIRWDEFNDTKQLFDDVGIPIGYGYYDNDFKQTLANLLFLDGVEGVILYGEYSKDGQDHMIKSCDDLMEWYDIPDNIEDKEHE